MPIEEVKLPDVLVIKWRDGLLAGAHVQWLIQLKDGERVLSESESGAMPIDIGAGNGFPLDDVLQLVHLNALTSIDTLNAELAEMTSARDAAQMAQERTAGELATATDRVTVLQAQIDELLGVGVIAGVPQTVSRFQARAALLGAGLLDRVELLMANADVPAIMKLAWADAQNFERQSPTLLALAAQLELDDASLDQLFITAAAIVA